jgi:integrase/recombinase XerD
MPIKWKDIGDPDDPEGLVAAGRQFLESLRVANYSRQTVQTRQKRLRPFFAWCNERGIGRPAEVTRPMLESYQRWLFHYRKDDGEPLDPATQSGMLVTVRMFFRFLARKGRIEHNPAADLELPKLGRRLPRNVLTPEEVEQVLARPDITEPLGLRDRAILELLYSTGIRRMEAINLALHDLDATRGTVHVRHGKGDRDRVVPIGERALAWVKKYIEEVRPRLVVDDDEMTLFLTQHGHPFTPSALTYIARQYIEATGKEGACHAFRHAMATAMLENGADIRFIQEMLGHAKVTSTEVYTRVAITKLKAIHAATHPAARLERTVEVREEQDPRAALLADLAAEAEDEDEEGG